MLSTVDRCVRLYREDRDMTLLQALHSSVECTPMTAECTPTAEDKRAVLAIAWASKKALGYML